MIRLFATPIFLLAFATILVTPAHSQIWEELSPSPFSGRHHGIGFSHDGFGYVISGSQTRDVWKYTPETDSWEQLADYSNVYRGFGIGVYVDGKEYFGFGFIEGGGQNGMSNDFWVYDPETETATELTSCPCEDRTHPAMVAFDDKVYMGLGGSAGGNLGDWWEYDITTDTWSQKATFIGANRHHPYQFRIGEYIYVGSGHQTDWYRYDPANDSWTQVATHPSYTRVAGIQFSHEGKGYTLSGVADYNNSDHEPMPTGEFWEYDPEEDTWTELPAHPGLSRWASASFIIDGWIYMVAGEVYDGNNSTYRYQLSDGVSGLDDEFTDAQLNLSPMPFSDYIDLPVDYQWTGALVRDVRGAILTVPNLESTRIHLGDLPAGIYLLELSAGEETYRQRVVKE